METNKPNGDTSGNPPPQEKKDESNQPNEADSLKAQLETERKTRLAAETRAQEVQRQLEETKKQSLKQKEDYKALFENSEKENATLKSENAKIKTSFFNTSRFQAAKEEAVKLGVKSEALNDLSGLDMSELEVKVDNDGLIKVAGAKEWAEKQKKIRPYLFKSPDDPKINPGGGGGGTNTTGTVTKEQLQKAFATRNKSPESMDAYRKMSAQFNKQTRQAGS